MTDVVFELYRADGTLQIDLAARLTKVAGNGVIPASGMTITNPMFDDGEIWCQILPTESPEAMRVGQRPLVTVYQRGSTGGARIVIGSSNTSAPLRAIWGIF